MAFAILTTIQDAIFIEDLQGDATMILWYTMTRIVTFPRQKRLPSVDN